jgi:hypothetical protein
MRRRVDRPWGIGKPTICERWMSCVSSPTTCVPLASGSPWPPTPSAAASSVRCTTGCNSNWWGSPPTSNSRRVRWTPTLRPRRSCSQRWPATSGDAMDQARMLADRIYPPAARGGGPGCRATFGGGGCERPCADRDRPRPDLSARGRGGVVLLLPRPPRERLGRLDGGDQDTERWGGASRSTSSWTATSSRTAPYSSIASRPSGADARSSRGPVTGRG